MLLTLFKDKTFRWKYILLYQIIYLIYKISYICVCASNAPFFIKLREYRDSLSVTLKKKATKTFLFNKPIWKMKEIAWSLDNNEVHL